MHRWHTRAPRLDGQLLTLCFLVNADLRRQWWWLNALDSHHPCVRPALGSQSPDSAPAGAAAGIWRTDKQMSSLALILTLILFLSPLKSINKVVLFSKSNQRHMHILFYAIFTNLFSIHTFLTIQWTCLIFHQTFQSHPALILNLTILTPDCI